jgi:hypothetical protein
LKPLRPDLGAALAALLVVAALPGRANAATDTLVRLDYLADEPAGCVGEEVLRRMVTDQLGHDPFRLDADKHVTIGITKTDTGFQGRIVWTEADERTVGERLLVSRSRDCREIAANVAFAVTLQLQLMERDGSKEPSVDVTNTQQPSPKTGDQATRERESAISQRPDVSAPAAPAPGPAQPALVLAVGAGPAVGIGMAPDATAFGRLFVAARFRRVSGEIAADGSLPVTQREPDGTGVVVNALGFSGAGCGHVSLISACALGRLGWIRAHGTGIAAPTASWGRFNELGVRLAGTREVGRFIFSLHADGLFMLSRWNVLLNDAVVWNVPRVGGVLGLDVALLFL